MPCPNANQKHITTHPLTYCLWTEGKEPKNNICKIPREIVRDICQQLQAIPIFSVHSPNLSL